jgi:pimeloyl-ACP methyl ester carboxylesterase
VATPASQIPKAFIDWHLAMSRETDWACHERDTARAIVGRHGYLPGLVLTNAEIAGIEQPTLMVYGTADPHRVDPQLATVHRSPAAGRAGGRGGRGHLVWYSDPGRVGARVAQFLTG